MKETQDHRGVEPIDAPIADVLIDQETSKRRSNMEMQSSTRYFPDEYIFLTSMKDYKGYDEVKQDTHRDTLVEVTMTMFQSTAHNPILFEK